MFENVVLNILKHYKLFFIVKQNKMLDIIFKKEGDNFMSSSLSKSKSLQLIQSVILIVVGILILLSVINAGEIVKYLCAIIITFVGCYMLFQSVYDSKSFTTCNALGGGILVGAGIATFAGVIQIESVFLGVVKVGIVCVGILLSVQAIIYLIQRKSSVFAAVYLTVGLVAIILGILILCNVISNSNAVYSIAGILLIAIGAVNLIAILTRLEKSNSKSSKSSS